FDCARGPTSFKCVGAPPPTLAAPPIRAPRRLTALTRSRSRAPLRGATLRPLVLAAGAPSIARGAPPLSNASGPHPRRLPRHPLHLTPPRPPAVASPSLRGGFRFPVCR